MLNFQSVIKKVKLLTPVCLRPIFLRLKRYFESKNDIYLSKCKMIPTRKIYVSIEIVSLNLPRPIVQIALDLDALAENIGVSKVMMNRLEGEERINGHYVYYF